MTAVKLGQKHTMKIFPVNPNDPGRNEPWGLRGCPTVKPVGAASAATPRQTPNRFSPNRPQDLFSDKFLKGCQNVQIDPGGGRNLLE